MVLKDNMRLTTIFCLIIYHRKLSISIYMLFLYVFFHFMLHFSQNCLEGLRIWDIWIWSKIYNSLTSISFNFSNIFISQGSFLPFHFWNFLKSFLISLLHVLSAVFVKILQRNKTKRVYINIREEFIMGTSICNYGGQKVLWSGIYKLENQETGEILSESKARECGGQWCESQS